MARHLSESKMSSDGWATNAAKEPVAALKTLQSGLSVSLIATERKQFKTCRINESLADAKARHTEEYDYLPVIERGPDGRDAIIGLADLTDAGSGQFVKDVFCPLDERILIGADASLLAFVRDADSNGCRLVVSGTEISGLVSLSDLQRLPVRAALFTLVTCVEIVMTEVIRRRYSRTEDWKKFLQAKRLKYLSDQVEAAIENDSYIGEDLLYTQFCDKIAIVRSILDKSDGGMFERDFGRIERLRNKLAHANDYAKDRRAAKKVCKIVRSIEDWIDKLTSDQAVLS